MSFFLRLTGTTNAAVWFGAAVFFMVGVWPAFSSREMLQILPPLHAEAAAQVALERYFILQYCCGCVALVHLVLEWLYAGRPVRRWLLGLVGGLLILGMFNGLSAGPRLKRLHLERYGMRSTPQQRQLAGEGLRFWRGVVIAINVVVVLGLWVYVTELNTPGTGARFVARGKLRG